MMINLGKAVASFIFSSAWDQVGLNYYVLGKQPILRLHNCLAHYSIYYSNNEHMWKKIFFGNNSIHGFIRESLL